jgi:acyl-CoA dehydrogenase
VAQVLQRVGEGRDRLTANIHIPDHPEEPLGRLEQALRLSVQADPVAKIIKAAVGRLPDAKLVQLVELALQSGTIHDEEATLIREAEALRTATIEVDSFVVDDEHKRGRTDWRTPPNSGRGGRKTGDIRVLPSALNIQEELRMTDT